MPKKSEEESDSGLGIDGSVTEWKQASDKLKNECGFQDSPLALFKLR